MHNVNLIRLRRCGLAILASVTFAACGGGTQGSADHTSFKSPEEAVAALSAALEKDDLATLGRILGPDSEGVLDSGDPVADKVGRAQFLENFKARNALVADGDDRRILQYGSDDSELAVPLVRREGRWYFDGAAGEDEIIYRRVGRNELDTIAVMNGFVEAQVEYAAVPHDGNPAGVFAERLMSDEGRQNGLYYPTAEGEPESPVGDFIAAAAAEGYRAGEAKAYHGYRYRPLFAQSANANGGAMSYYEDGLLVNGFALLAWPAEYGVSGVMTFIVNQDGVVFQKDLGEETDSLVESINTFDPGDGWVAIVE
jgi:hypothetical protein